MRRKGTLDHAGCPVRPDAGQRLAPALCAVEVVHLCTRRDRIAEAESAGVAPVPTLVLGGTGLHITFGASLADVKGTA